MSDFGPWYKSSYSGNAWQECVEVAESPRAVKVRDSKQPDLAVLLFGAVEWRAFVAEADQL